MSEQLNAAAAAGTGTAQASLQESSIAAGSGVIAIFPTHTDAERAVRSLARAGFDMGRLSIIGKGYHTEERALGFYTFGNRLKVWGSRGAFWGGLLGLLVSPAFFLLPVMGHVLVLGPLVTSVIGVVEGAAAVGGMSVLAAAIASLGVPRDSVIRYETAIKADKFVLIAHGTPEDAERAGRILRAENGEHVEQYNHEV